MLYSPWSWSCVCASCHRQSSAPCCWCESRWRSPLGTWYPWGCSKRTHRWRPHCQGSVIATDELFIELNLNRIIDLTWFCKHTASVTHCVPPANVPPVKSCKIVVCSGNNWSQVLLDQLRVFLHQVSTRINSPNKSKSKVKQPTVNVQNACLIIYVNLGSVLDCLIDRAKDHSCLNYRSGECNNVPITSSHFNTHKRKAALKFKITLEIKWSQHFMFPVLPVIRLDDWIIHYTYNYVNIYIYICLELHPRPLAIPSGRLCRCSHCQRRHPPPRWPSAAGHAREVPVPSIGL